jgi:hypothetical protein
MRDETACARRVARRWIAPRRHPRQRLMGWLARRRVVLFSDGASIRPQLLKPTVTTAPTSSASRSSSDDEETHLNVLHRLPISNRCGGRHAARLQTGV